MKNKKVIKIIFFISIFSFAAIYLFVNFSPYFQNRIEESLIKKYAFVNDSENSSCFSSKSSVDFNKVYKSNLKYTFNYPDYLPLDIHNEKNFDSYDNATQYADVSLHSEQDPKLTINFDVQDNKKFDETKNNSTKLPCSFISGSIYYTSSYPNSITKEMLYYTDVYIPYPENQQNLSYLWIECIDKTQNRFCDVFMPQLLSTLTLDI